MTVDEMPSSINTNDTGVDYDVNNNIVDNNDDDNNDDERTVTIIIPTTIIETITAEILKL